MASATEDLTMDNQFSPKAGTSKIPQAVQADMSPDAKCPICLDRFENMSYIDRCFHKFCFRCIQEWSRNKAECPLCKQPFSSIFHSVRTESDFQEYVLKASENGSFGSPDGQRFRYRTTLTRDRRMTFQSRRSLVTSPLPDNGVVFEGLGRQSRSLQGRSLRRMIARLGARRRAQSEGKSVRMFQEQEMVNFRRELYRSGVRVRNVQDGGRYRDISAEFFRRNAACLHRLVPWLKRELCVLFGSHGSVVNIVQHIIMSNIARYDLESEAFQEDLRPFLLSRTDHFLHEFISFARAPFNMEAYDQRANYDCPAPSYEEESDSDLSVITISPEMENIQEEDRPAPNSSEVALSLSQAAWDDETPGPSYSIAETAEQGDSSPTETTVSLETPPQAGPSSQSVLIKADPGLNEETSNRSGDDCLIMGYVKPLAERTPELIELSSDTEASVPETDNKTVEQPVHLQFHSTIPGSQSTSSNSSNKISRTSYSSTPSSPSARSSESKERWKRKKTKRTKHGQSKREEHRGHKKSCHSGDSSSSSCRDRARISSRSKSASKSRSGLRSHSRDRHAFQRHTRARSRDGLTHPDHSRDRHRDKGWKRRSNRDRSSSRDHAGSGSSDSRTYWNREQRRRRSKERDRKSSRRSLTQPRLSDSLVYRSRDRSRSWNRGYPVAREERGSRSRERMYSYMREYQERSRSYSYQWEKYSYHSRTNDGHDSIIRTRAHYRRGSPSSDYRMQSSSESTSFRSPSSHREDVFYHYGSYRSRSPSSRFRVSGRTEKMSQEKPGGKRKYKTHYLESSSDKGSTSTALQVTNVSEGHAMPRNESTSPGRLSQCSRKNSHHEPQAVPGRPASLNRLREKEKRSSSVEIVYEGKVTETSKRHKKRKKHKKKLKRDRSSEERTECTAHSPIVITIDSHSDSDAVVVTSIKYYTSDLGTAGSPLRLIQCETREEKCTAEPEEDKDSLNVAVPASSQISSESLDICSLSTDSDFGPENPSAQACSDQDDMEPVSDTDTHQSVGVQEQEHKPHSNRTPLPKSTPDRPPLILKIPKRFLNRTNLFHQSA